MFRNAPKVAKAHEQAARWRPPNLSGAKPKEQVFARPLVVAVALAAVSASAHAQTSTPDPDFTLAVRETADFWRNVSGGLSVGYTTLNKLQLSGTWAANRLGDPGFRLHAQVFRTNGERLTSRTGDLQTASNIEALSADRLFEAWGEQAFGKPGQGGVAIRAGLIDLNTDFDSIDPASLFIDSSHGIAPDLSKSGRNGPSIFPVSSLALRLTWTPSDQWTVRGGLFDGVPGDPARPKAFAAARLSASDGALMIAELDRKLGKDAQVSLGAWGYTAPIPGLEPGPARHDTGLFGFVGGTVPGVDGLKGWIRAGRGEPDVQVIDGYLGMGLVKTAPFSARKADRLGFAVSRAFISPAAQRTLGVREAETTFEATYQLQLADAFALQPDIQYIVNPSSQAAIPNALDLGLRLVLTGGFPKRGKATEASDPAVPPDAPKPEEPENGSNAPSPAPARPPQS